MTSVAHAPAAGRVERLELDSRIPRHVAIIMDGNGRWAHERGRSREFGHRAGMIAAGRAVDAALGAGVPVLTLFAFSDENWRRPTGEVSALLSGLELHLRRGVEVGLRKKGVAVRVLGELGRPRRGSGRRSRTSWRRRVEGTASGSTSPSPTAAARRSFARRDASRRRRARFADCGRDRRGAAANLDTAGSPGPADPDVGRAPRVELPALADRVCGAALHACPLARLHAAALPRGDRRVRAARRHGRVTVGAEEVSC